MNILKQLDILNHIYNIITTNILSGYNTQLDYKYTSTIEFNSTPTLLINFCKKEISGDILVGFSHEQSENLIINVSNTTNLIFNCDLIECNFKDMKETCIRLETMINKLLVDSKLK